MINNSTEFVDRFKKKYDIGEDLPTDLTALFGKLDVSVLPETFAADTDNYILCEFATDTNGRRTIRYREEFLAMAGFPDRVVSVQALCHHVNSGKTDFFITNEAELSEQDKLLAYELMMPMRLVEEMFSKLESPTVSVLSKIFHVPQEFVRNRLDAMCTEKQIAGYNY